MSWPCRLKIAFCKYAGLAAGGTEKYLQSLALLYKKAGHIVDYYYTDATPIDGTTWQHPDTCPIRRSLLQSAGINTKFVKAQRRAHVDHYSEWIGTDFFDLFDESQYDYLVTAGDGRAEFPYYLLKQIPIIHTVHGWHAYNAPNVRKSVLLCNWQAQRWIVNGGDENKLEVIPPLIPIPDFESGTFRQKHKIPEDALVFGLHQAPGVASLVSLEAFSEIVTDNVYYVILGGDGQHRSLCKNKGIRNVIFLPIESDARKVHAFLDGIDVYAHCRRDGEVCSASLIEAMAHGKPIVSHVGDGTNLGHLEQVEGIGRVTNNVREYAKEMRRYFDRSYRQELAAKATQKYSTTYEHGVVADRIIALL
jgi:glycosyltransferase involved in cell wall biosynthesis